VAKRAQKVALADKIRVTVKTPADLPYISRGFYQVEENALYVPILPAGRFFSFLDSPQLHIDADNAGRPLFIQIIEPRKSWQVRADLVAPKDSPPADIRFLSFRDQIPAARIETSSDNTIVRITFIESGERQSYAVAENLIFDITPDKTLAAIWILNIEEDRAAKAMAQWRKKTKEELGESPAHRSRYLRIEID
jgi:hypothetical protein